MQEEFCSIPYQEHQRKPKFVCLAMDCYYKGLSYRDI